MIKIGYCVAYDWDLLYYSIPQIYDSADLICLSIDKNRRSWSGPSFNWDQQGFEVMLKKLDPAGKIRLYEDDFYQSGLTPMQNEVRQRNLIAQFMGEGGWHIQLDADEYFVDFAGFTSYLKSMKGTLQVNVCCPWITLYKHVQEGFLWVKPEKFSQVEYIQIATTNPRYEYGRRNGYFNILTDFRILHQSWARSEKEILQKLQNWGHSSDFDVMAYFDLWRNVGVSNYHTYKDFHHLNPGAWPALGWAKGSSVEEVLQNHKDGFPLPITEKDLALANSIWVSRLKKLVNTIFKKVYQHK